MVFEFMVFVNGTSTCNEKLWKHHVCGLWFVFGLTSPMKDSCSPTLTSFCTASKVENFYILQK